MATKTHSLTFKCLKVRATVEFEIELEDFETDEETGEIIEGEKVELADVPSTKEELAEALVGEWVKVKSGEFENRVMGTLQSIDSVEEIEVERTAEDHISES